MQPTVMIFPVCIEKWMCELLYNIFCRKSIILQLTVYSILLACVFVVFCSARKMFIDQTRTFCQQMKISYSTKADQPGQLQNAAYVVSVFFCITEHQQMFVCKFGTRMLLRKHFLDLYITTKQNFFTITNLDQCWSFGLLQLSHSYMLLLID